MSTLLAALVVTVSALAAFLATKVDDELLYLEKPLRFLQAVSGLALLFVLPWWGALIIAGALAFGGAFLLGGVGVLVVLVAWEGSAAGLAATSLVLGILAGGRWALDREGRGKKTSRR